VSDICIIGGRRFVLNVDREPIIAELDDDGRVIRAFGDAEKPSPDLARQASESGYLLQVYHNRALMACDATSETIVLVHENIPVVRAVTLAGHTRWRTTLGDYVGRVLGVSRSGRGHSFRIDREVGKAHSGSAVAIASNEYVVVTLWLGGARDMEGQLDARILDLNTGAELYRRVPPARVTDFLNDRAYAFVQQPVPGVRVYRTEQIFSR
jgi:hypothetical protein